VRLQSRVAVKNCQYSQCFEVAACAPRYPGVFLSSGWEMSSLGKRCGAEFFGTFWLVLGGCGAAVLAAGFPGLGIGFAGVALAFGLTVLTMAFAVGHISGGHFNPAVTIGLVAGGRFPAREIAPYVVAQVLGAIVAAAVLAAIASGQAGFDLQGSGFAAKIGRASCRETVCLSQFT